MKATGVILVFSLLTKAFSAPVDISVDKKAGPRVSTKEILNLEQQLKAQAGEDKKFYPSEMRHKNVPPPQQVDGLEDKDPETSRVGQHPGIPGPEKGPEDAVAEQLINLAEQITPEQLESLSNRLGPIAKQMEPIRGQLDLAQQDELEAAEKRHEHLEIENTPDQLPEEDMETQEAENDIKDAHFYREPEEGGDVASEIANEAPQEAEMGEQDTGQGEEEALFMQGVIEALRDRPQLLQQFLQGRLDDNIPIETRVPAPEDDADRAAVIRAEYLAATGAGRGQRWGQQGSSFIPAELLSGEQLLRPIQVEGIRELEAGVPSDVAAAAREQAEEIARQRYADLEEYQEYQGDKEARVVKKAYSVKRPQYSETLDDYRVRPEMMSTSSEEGGSKSDSEESKEDSSMESPSNSKEDTSHESSESKETQDMQELATRKRVDMHPRFVM